MRVCLNRTAALVFQRWLVLSSLGPISATALTLLLLISPFPSLLLAPRSLHKARIIRYECIAVTCQTRRISILCNIPDRFDIIWPDISCRIVDDLVLGHSVQGLE
jgi:hypothetical protein